MTVTKNILLIGRSGRGKSTLANVLISQEGKFKESSSSASETRKIQYEQFKDKENNYLIIDTPGIGDTKMSDNEMLDIIAEAVYLVRDGLSQVLFTINSRFDKAEMATYNLLRTIIFDEYITKHTTIVRTRFSNFRVEELCQNDIVSMSQETKLKKAELEKQITEKGKKLEKLNSDSEEYKTLKKEIQQLNKELTSTLSEIIGSCQDKVIHVDNPPMDIDDEEELELNKEDRNESRKKILKHLSQNYQEDYKPFKLQALSNDISADMDKLLQSRAELEKEMKKLKTSNIRSSNVQIIPTIENIVEDIDKNTQKLLEENDNVGNHLAIGKIKELEDKKARLKKEIAEKEKLIRQKVLKHIFNNLDNISNELGGDIFMQNVVGDHQWENISLEFKDNKLVIKWLNEKFDYEQISKWAIALGKGFDPEQDTGFCAWLRDEKQLTVDKVQALDYPHNIEQLRKEYVDYLERETEVYDKYSQKLDKKEKIEDWIDIDSDFGEECYDNGKIKTYQQIWEEFGFDYQKTKEWKEVLEERESFEVSDLYFCVWLRDDKNLTPQEIKQKDNLENLRIEYNGFWADIHSDFTSKLQKKWEKNALNCQDTQLWIMAGFKPNDYDEVLKMKVSQYYCSRS